MWRKLEAVLNKYFSSKKWRKEVMDNSPSNDKCQSSTSISNPYSSDCGTSGFLSLVVCRLRIRIRIFTTPFRSEMVRTHAPFRCFTNVNRDRDKLFLRNTRVRVVMHCSKSLSCGAYWCGPIGKLQSSLRDQMPRVFNYPLSLSGNQ
jgi:hypothetical protein